MKFGGQILLDESMMNTISAGALQYGTENKEVNKFERGIL